jgi:tetratricopeptide (TPR) repeat protein
VKQRLRIFVSSPGDVEAARRIAALTIVELAKDYTRFFTIEPYLWEFEAMVASGHFQDSIEPPSAFDIVVLILWSRLGTHLPAETPVRKYQGRDGRTPVTGTEWEFEDALQAAIDDGAPDLLVYRNTMPAPFDTDPERFREQRLQLEALNGFWARHFRDKGMFIAAYTTFKRDAEFAAALKSHLDQLIKKRLALLKGIQSDQVTWTQAPFRGLEAYEFEHAPIFFGQNEALEKATLRLAENADAGSSFLLVMGASGSGKSSLVKAGIVPRLFLPRLIPGTAFLRRVIFRPSDAQKGEDLFDALARRLTTQVSVDEGLSELIGPSQSATMLAAHFRGATAQPAFPLGSALGQLSVQARQSGRMLEYETAKLVLVIDQLEELFTIERTDPGERQRFVDLLAGLVRSGLVWVIATMRRDFWHRAGETPELVRLSEGNGRLELMPPGPAQLSQMIRRPAEEAGVNFEEDGTTHVPLNEVIAEEVAREPGGLPLLSYLLDQLYRKDVLEDHGNTLTYKTYQKLGKLAGAIATRAEEVLQRCTPEERDCLGSVLFSLVQLGGGGSDVERVVARRAPLSLFAAGTPRRRLVEAFLDPEARLLVSDAEHGASPTVRVAHEALITSWPLAQDYVHNNGEALKIHRRIEERYARWHALQDTKPATAPDPTAQSSIDRSGFTAWWARLGREQGLLSDIDIADGRRLLKDHRADTEPQLVAYIERSIAQDRRIRMRAVRALALVAIIVTVLAIIAFTQRNFARSETAIANTTAQFMVHMFENADPAKSGGDRITARQMLDVGATTIRSETDLARAPRMRSELQTTIGRAYMALGLYPPAQTALSQARADQATAWVPDESRIRTLLASGTTLFYAGNDDEAAPYLHQAADLARKSLKASNPLHSEALTGLADLLAADGKYAEAEQLCREALEADRQRGSSSEDKAVLANTLDSLGTTFYYRGDLPAAEAPMREALKIREDVFGMDHPLTAASLANLGALLYQSGQYKEAVDLYKLALPIDEKVYDPEHPAVAGILNDMGRSLLMAGDVDAAEPLLRRSLAITVKTEGEQHLDVVAPLNSLAMIDAYKGHLEAARTEFQRAESIARLPDHGELLDQVLLNEASMELPGGDRARAGALLAESKALLQKAHPDAKTDAWRYAVWDTVNAGLLAANGDTAAAMSTLAAAQKVIDARFGPTSYYSQFVRTRLKTLEKTSTGRVAS